MAPHLGRGATEPGDPHRPPGRVVEGAARSARDPAAPRAAPAARGHPVGVAPPSVVRHGLGRPSRGPAHPRPELHAGRRRAHRRRRVQRPGQRPQQRPARRRGDGRRRHSAARRARRVRARRVRPRRAPASRRSSSVASTPGTCARPAATPPPGFQAATSTRCGPAMATGSSASGNRRSGPSCVPTRHCSNASATDSHTRALRDACSGARGRPVRRHRRAHRGAGQISKMLGSSTLGAHESAFEPSVLGRRKGVAVGG